MTLSPRRLRDKLDACDPIADAWRAHAATLAEAWSDTTNRRDAFVAYGPDGPRHVHKSLTLGALRKHFDGTGPRIGVHSTNPIGNTCLWAAPEVDAHGDDVTYDDAAANEAAVLDVAEWLRAEGWRPLIEDTNGAGGFRIRIHFDEPADAARAHAFARLICEQLLGAGAMNAEAYPKQPRIRPDGYGNVVRLPGRHHKRAHYSRFHDGERWLEGQEAVHACL